MNLMQTFKMIQGQDAVTDEEYLSVLRRKRAVYVVMLVLGLITAVVALLAYGMEWDIAVTDHNMGFFCGVGSGLTGGSIAMLLRLRRTLRDQKRLREERVKYTDERLREIARRAWVVAGLMLLIALYLVGIIGGLFYPVLHTVLAVLAGVFLVTYAVTYFVLDRRM